MKKLKEKICMIVNMELTGWKWFIFTCFLTFGVVGGAALAVFIVDPYYRYHAPFFYDKVYYKVYNTAPHLLKHEKYDLFMLGSSMTRNFFIEDIDKTFNCSSLKLAASGATSNDLCKFLSMAIEEKKGKLKKIILSLDIYSLNKKGSHWEDFDFMYRTDHSQDYRYLFSRETFSSMFYLLKRKFRPKRQRAHQADRNRMFATEYEGKPYGIREVIKDARFNEVIHHTQTPFKASVFRQNFYGKLLPVFDRNPDILFTIYLPPYHIYTYCQSQHFGEADALIRQRTKVLKELLKRPNVTLHDFQSDASYVANHDYFSDVQHFSNIAARRLLKDLISNRRRLASEAQILANEKELRRLIQKTMPAYDAHMKPVRRK